MKQFITKYAHTIKGVLSGFDRLVFRGSMRSFNFDAGRQFYLYLEKLPYKDFVEHARKTTERVKIASLAPVQAEGRPVVYLASSKISKEETAKRIATENQITEGNICVLTVVEPCMGLDIIGNKATHRLEIVARPRKCLHYYHYRYHPVFGFMNARIQTYFPFAIQICMNGREWLSRQLDGAGLGLLAR